MTNIIKIKRTSTPSSTPASLEHGELAINYSDGKIFYKNSSNQITQFSSGQKITSSTTAPASPASGDLWFESDTAKTFIYYDSFWVEICGALVAASSDGTTTLTTKGDLLSRSSSGLNRLAVGTNGYFLKANSATATGLEWGAIPTVSILDDVGDVIITSATSGDILKWNGSNWVNDSALLAAKAPLASPTFTGTVSGITATMVGLGSVDNTSDTAKPVSTAQQTALDLKANLASPTFTGTVTIPSGASISGFAPLASPALTGTPTAPLAVTTTNTTQVATTSFVQQEITALIGGAPTALNTLTELAAAINNDASYASTLTTALALKAPLASPTFTGTVTIPSGASISGFAPLASPTFTGTVSGITATMVGLGNVDNTADTAKPVSTAQQTALNLKADLASPTLTGTPIAPTAAGGTNTTQIATTAFVTTAVSGATITSLDDVADVTITSNSSGHFLKWNGTAWVNDAIDLGTDTTGSYVTSLVAGTGVTLAGNSGEGATPTVTVDTTVIQARVANVTDTEIGYLDGVTSAIQTQIDTKLASSTAGTTYAPLASPTFTGTVTIPTGASITAPTGLVKGDVGLGNVDNTSDANKPVSTAQQTALDLKANLASPTFTGTTTLNDATVSGNLIVSGTTTSINTETLTVDDNIIILNNNATGAPSQDAGIEIERGTSTNVQIRWNETTDKWQFTNDGTTYNDLGAGGATISDTPPASPVTGQLWYESDTGLAYVYYDSFWVEIGGGSAYDTVINTIQAKGDLLAGTASQTLDRLTVGTNNQRLIANSSATTGLAWANDTTNTVIDTKGDLLVGATADVVAKLPVGTDNQVLVANSSATNGLAWVDQPLSFRNKVINGDMRIAQRGTATITGSGTAQYPVDRWAVYNGTGTVTFVQSTDAPAGFNASILATVTVTGSYSTAGYTQVTHKIEGFNCQDLAYGTASAKPIILSFWVKSSVVGTQNVSFKNGGNNRVYVATYTVDVANTWEKKIISVVGDTTGTWLVDSGMGLEVTFNLGMGTQYDATAGSWQALAARYSTSDAIDFAANSGATWRVTGVQFEANTMATPFEQRPIGTELGLCQRYYQRRSGTGSTAYTSLGGFGAFGSTTAADFDFVLPVVMRVVPHTLDYHSVSGFIGSTSNTSYTSTGLNIQTVTATSSVFAITLSGMSGTAGVSMRILVNNSTSGYLGWSAEL